MKKVNIVKGFTLIELLVVIAIIALLLSILMPALGRVKEQSRKVVCGSNQRQLHIGLSIYGVENRDFLPSMSALGLTPAQADGTIGDWLFDIPYFCAEFLRKSHDGTYSMFYCPSNRKKPAPIEEYYVSHASPSNPNPVNQGWVLTDYFWMFTWGTQKRSDLTNSSNIYQDGAYKSKRIFVKKMGINEPSRQPLIADVTWCKTSAATDWSAHSNSPMGPFRTNHISGSGNPYGGNIIFCDGHVEWISHSDQTLNRPRPDARHYW